jgi:hypothetical protein
VTIDFINIWDLDNAVIGASSTQLCYPDTTVLLANNTEKNCTANGNTTQRFEKWNFGDLDNNGVDDIIDWRPWTSSTPFELDLPGIGTYYVMLYDSSYCGIDSTQIELIVCDECDECGVCGGPGAIYACGCADIPAGECDCYGNVLDECGTCGGSGIADGTCDCSGSLIDECGVCGGNNECCHGPECCGEGTVWDEVTQTCIITNPTDSNLDGCTDLNDLMDILSAYGICLDACGVPNGDNSSCLDACGVPNGDNSTCLDECGVPNGDNSTCADCAGVANGTSVVDECGTCDADASNDCSPKTLYMSWSGGNYMSEKYADITLTHTVLYIAGGIAETPYPTDQVWVYDNDQNNPSLDDPLTGASGNNGHWNNGQILTPQFGMPDFWVNAPGYSNNDFPQNFPITLEGTATQSVYFNTWDRYDDSWDGTIWQFTDKPTSDPTHQIIFKSLSPNGGDQTSGSSWDGNPGRLEASYKLNWWNPAPLDAGSSHAADGPVLNDTNPLNPPFASP